MNVSVRLSTTLRRLVPGYKPAEGLEIEIETGSLALDLARRLNLPPEEIKIVMLNGRRVNLETPLAEGDRVGFFPAVGGGSGSAAQSLAPGRVS
ncbi:MAG: MoaD/ThiS family protein [Deltaproteobacteria bacterium]|jgi:molybdopterin converting factor small subunit|nr:MoaD/ThiS family protein [Deltaproteobacteria bacterium]